MINATGTYVVEHGVDDSEVTLECREENSVGRSHRHGPDWGSCEPHATDELIIDTVT